MQVLLDFLPVIAFVVAYWLTDLHTAIAVIMVAVALQVGITWLIKRTVHRMLLVSAILVEVFGGLSLYLNNDLVFKWKPTVLNWLFAAVFLASQFFGRQTVIQRVLTSVSEQSIALTPRQWQQLNLMWVVYFTVSGAVNLFVAYTFSQSVWVNFKLFGLLGLTIVFVALQAFWLSRRDTAASQENTGKR